MVGEGLAGSFARDQDAASGVAEVLAAVGFAGAPAGTLALAGVLGARRTVRRQRVIEFNVLTKLITTASPIAPRLYPGGNYAQERDDYVGSYRAATD